MNINRHKNEFSRQQFTVIAAPENDALVNSALDMIKSGDMGEWVPGDDSSHSWRESSGPLPFAISALLPFELATAIVGRPIARHVEWFNVYGEGEFIAGHRDADGDFQMLIGIAVPPISNGGQLWLGHRDAIIPMRRGDLLLFEAAKLVHGTTPIVKGAGIQRVTLNVRMWH
jgi:hypothetical protein